MAFKEKPVLKMQFAGDVKNDVVVSFPYVKVQPVEEDIQDAATIFNGKLTEDVTAQFDFAYYNSDSIVAESV